MKKLFDCQQAAALMKNGSILILSSSETKTSLRWLDNAIRINNDHASLSITEEDFVLLYQHEQFFVFDIPELDQDAMKRKDDEYYGWKHK